MGTQIPLPQRSTVPQFLAHTCCGQMAGWIKMPLGMEVGLIPSDFVLDGDPALPSQKGGRAPPPIFGQFLLWPNGWMHQDATWYGGRPQHRPHCARWGPSSPPLKEHSPQFSTHVRCGQTAGWTKMPLSVEIGLGPGDLVLDGDPAASPRKKGTAAEFSVHVYCGQMEQLDGPRWWR